MPAIPIHTAQGITALNDGVGRQIHRDAIFLMVTSPAQGAILRLPSGAANSWEGQTIEGWVGANGFTLTGATSINGSTSYAVPPNYYFSALKGVGSLWVVELVNALGTGGGVPDIGVATLLMIIGDSNAAGQASDQGSLVYTPDASVFSLNSAGNFAQYVPGTFTGRSSGSDTGNVGPEMQFSRLHRAADPTKPVFIWKNAYPGSLQTGQWDPATGAYVAESLTGLATAKSKMAALGYTPKVVVVVNLGINDTGLAQASKYTYGTVARSMYTAIKAVLGVGDIIVQNRVTEDSTGAFAVRCMQQAKTKNETVVFLADTDGFGKNGGDVTHYNLAGQNSLGAAAYNIFMGTDPGLRLNFYSDNFSAIGPTITWSLNPGWAITGGKMVGTTVPAFGATGILLPFEPGKSYRNSYAMVFGAGGVRVQMLGGTTVTGATRTSTNTFTETLVANANNTQFAWNATGGGFSGDMDNLLIEEL